MVELERLNMLNNNIEFNILQLLLSQHFGAEISDLIVDNESMSYNACRFNINNLKFIYRSAKITPRKIGQFVTVWKRNNTGITVPFSLNDHLDYYLISAQNDSELGYFIFPAAAMRTKNILADLNESGGKRGFRIYPPWDKPTSKQAVKTQKWQNNYFFDYRNPVGSQKQFNEYFNCS